MFCRYRLLADNRQLEINSAEVSADTARFTCIAMSEAGVADRDFDLDVLGKQYMGCIGQRSLSLSYQKKDWWVGSHQSFFWCDNGKDLEACFCATSL